MMVVNLFTVLADDGPPILSEKDNGGEYIRVKTRRENSRGVFEFSLFLKFR